MNIDEIQREILNRELNLDKIFSLDESKRELIIKLYDDLLNGFYNDKNGMSMPGGIQINYLRVSSIFNTLINNEYLVTRREKNINDILEKN